MKTKILFVLSLLFGLMMINAGLNKFFNYMPPPADMPDKMVRVWNAFTEIGWIMPLVGVIEIIGGLLFIFPKTRALGAIVIFPITIGILLTNTLTEPSGAPIALIMLAVNIVVLVEYRDKYLALVR